MTFTRTYSILTTWINISIFVTLFRNKITELELPAPLPEYTPLNKKHQRFLIFPMLQEKIFSHPATYLPESCSPRTVACYAPALLCNLAADISPCKPSEAFIVEVIARGDLPLATLSTNQNGWRRRLQVAIEARLEVLLLLRLLRLLLQPWRRLRGLFVSCRQ